MLSQNLISILFSKHSITVHNLANIVNQQKNKACIKSTINIYVTQYYPEWPNTNCSSEINQTCSFAIRHNTTW